MLFSSNIFFYIFLPLFLLCYLGTPGKWKNITLLIFSLLFYYYGEQSRVFILLFSLILNWGAGLFIANNALSLNKPKQLSKQGRTFFQKIVLVATVSANLLLLGYFKYFNFFIDNINHLFTSLGVPPIDELQIIMPIGISFFTFQSISYVVDIYRGEIKANRNLLSVSTYISMFPQLIAGPIVRYSEISRFIDKKRGWNLDDFNEGIYRFSVGFAKKILIANTLSVCADKVFALPATELTPLLGWIGITAYGLQIYFDFSGYSDMAIGLGRMLGFTFPENFNYPYISKSVTEFWRRWHMTLSRFFRDYLYIPLGGNRKGQVRTFVHLFVVFLLCGFWHGASWNFIVWGSWFGIFLVMERLFLIKYLNKYSILPLCYTLLIVFTGWVFFRAETLSSAINYLKVIFFLEKTGASPDISGYLTSTVIIAGSLGIIGSTPAFNYISKICRRNGSLFSGARFLWIAFILYASLIELALSSYNPFLYFRF